MAFQLSEPMGFRVLEAKKLKFFLVMFVMAAMFVMARCPRNAKQQSTNPGRILRIELMCLGISHDSNPSKQ